MMSIDELNEKFGIEAEVGFYEEGELVYTMVSNKHADATISLYGAHLLNYNPARNMEVLWMSSESAFETGKAIRGGIPVCFPWFGLHETNEKLPQHGFARLMNWEVTETKTLNDGATRIVMQLCSTEESKKYWPHDFCAEMIFTIGEKLEVALKITNPGDTEWDYTCALHTYFSVSAIQNISIEGLEKTPYQNQLDGGDHVQEAALLQINKPTTHHYYNTVSDTVIHDPVFNRRIRIEKSGSKNTTVWNPWAETCAQIGDMPDNAYETFVCVETVNKFNNEIRLAPGKSHTTTAAIGIE